MRHQFETAVGAEGVAFACKHTGRIFVLTLERKSACSVGITARHGVEHQPLQDFAVVFVLGQRHFADDGATQRFGGECRANFFVADFHHVFVASVGSLHGRPLREQFALRSTHAFFALFGQVASSFGGFGATGFVDFEHVGRGHELLDFTREFGLGARTFFVATHGVADFCQIACARCRDDRGLVGAVAHAHQRQQAIFQF